MVPAEFALAVPRAGVDTAVTVSGSPSGSVSLTRTSTSTGVSSAVVAGSAWAVGVPIAGGGGGTSSSARSASTMPQPYQFAYFGSVFAGYVAVEAVAHMWALTSSARSPPPFEPAIPFDRTSATTPATWGDAIEVPLKAR